MRKYQTSCYASQHKPEANQDWSYFTSILDLLNITYKIIKHENVVKEKIQRSSYVRVVGRLNLIKLGDYIYQNYDNDKIGFIKKRLRYLDIKNSVIDKLSS